MSKRDALGKLYDRLTPEERFRLDVEARARGDEEESRRLLDTCSRRNYVMTDVRFSGRWGGAQHVSMAALTYLRQAVAKLRMIGAFRATLPYSELLAQHRALEAYIAGHEAGSRHTWSRSGMDGAPPGYGANEAAGENADPQVEKDLEKIEGQAGEEPARLILELLERLEQELATEALAMWEAFRGFCEEEAGIGPHKLLRAAFEPALEDVGWFEDLCERLGLEANPEAVEACREEMVGCWQLLLDRG